MSLIRPQLQFCRPAIHDQRIKIPIQRIHDTNRIENLDPDSKRKRGITFPSMNLTNLERDRGSLFALLMKSFLNYQPSMSIYGRLKAMSREKYGL